MSVWMCCPSKRPPAESEPIFAKWRERGYKLALWHDCEDLHGTPAEAAQASRHLIGYDGYPGYARAQNDLIATVFRENPDCDWIVSAADDMEPDANHSAEEIAAQCSAHFSILHGAADLGCDEGPTLPKFRALLRGRRMATFGVMQCTGDRWGIGHAGGGSDKAYADMVAGSPWIGRSFAQRVYGGRGPYWPEYTHMYVDNELRAVAMKLGCYWERRDLIHLHQHWGRPREGEPMGQRSRMPAFLAEANSPVSWDRYKRLFEAREKAGFPGHEVIE